MMGMLNGVLLLVAALVAGTAQAQVPPSTKVYGLVANYTDTTSFRDGPEKLRRILRTAGEFYAEGSGGAHRFIADVHPTVLVLPQARPAGKCERPDPGTLSAALRDGGIDLKEYHALVLVVPASAQGCPGGVQTAFRHLEADGMVRSVPLAMAWSLTERYIVHEIVHTHGIGHANSLICPKATLAADCRTREYGNAWDLMGHDGGGLRMISAPLRRLMGWTEPLVHRSGRATYTIGAATKSGGLPTAVEVRLPFSGNDAVKVREPLTLWIEYRAPFGFDTRMASTRVSGFATGAMVNLTGSWQVAVRNKPRSVACPLNSPCLLDMTPQTPNFGDGVLAIGQSWTEPFTGTRISVDSRTETTLTVTVTSP
jgi:hypothetical protein